MKNSSLYAFTLLGAFLLEAATVTSRAQTPPSTILTPPLRYLLVIDTSFSMARIERATRQALFDLLYSGLQGHMQPGDGFAIWCFDEQVYSNRTSLISWDPLLNRAIAMGATRSLRDLRFEKQTRLDRLWNALQQTARSTKLLTVVILSDGDERIQGTPFDRTLNAIYKERFRELRSAKKPFVTTLIAQDGVWVASTVNAVGEPIDFNALNNQIPQTPPPSILTEAPSVPAELINQPAISPEIPTADTRPKPATTVVAATPESSKTNSTPPPTPPPVTQPAESPTDATSTPEVNPEKSIPTTSLAPPPETARPIVTSTEKAVPETTTSVLPPPIEMTPPPSTPDTTSQPTVESSVESVKTPIPVEPKEPPTTTTATVESTQPSPATAAPNAAEMTTPETNVPAPVPAPQPSPTTTAVQDKKTSPQPIAIANPAQYATARQLYLVLGAALLLIGLWLCYWLLRRSRSKMRTSFISQSLERDRK